MSNAEHLHAIMAGYGAPGRLLTPTRKQILRALHDGTSVAEIPAIAGILHAALEGELSLLMEIGLLHQENNRYEPTFLVVDADETRRVCEHAGETGKQLSDYLLSHWSTFEERYRQLTIRDRYDFHSLAFFLVGSIVLDVGLLVALAKDKSLMPDKPHRPNPGHPDAHYYFWMIEGEWDQLGRYGQRSTSLIWEKWQLITYGQYKINGIINTHRDGFEKVALSAVDTQRATSPEILARLIGAPLFAEEDSKKWASVAQSYSEQIVTIYHQNEKPIRDLYATLRASHHKPEGFGEFFCWYDHVAYASAIDHLVEAGAMKIPDERYIAVIWHEVMSAGL